MIREEKAGLEWLTFEHLSRFDFLIHGFSTRIGGNSASPYNTLNLAFHVGDVAEKVIANRQRFCQALDLSLRNLVAGDQVHSDAIHVVTKKDRGRGAFDQVTAIKKTDGLITNQPGVVLSSYYADCVPLFIFDPIQRVIGLAHGGWQGSIKRIGERTLEAMVSNFSTNPRDCLAGIGPSIGVCCYEVDQRVLDPLKAAFADWEKFVIDKGNGRWQLDLWEINRQVFLTAGLCAENIEVTKLCTSCHPDLFFSYRGDKGITGRMASLISLKVTPE